MSAANSHGATFWSGVHMRVLGLASLVAFLTYTDRVCIAITAPAMRKDLHLDSLQMGFVFSSFTLAYAIFEVPTGWWADRTGSRRVLARIIVWWSIFTGLTAVAWNFPTLVITRFLFGAGEAGAWPTIARALSQWFPPRKLAKAQGFFFAGAHLGGGLTPLLISMLAVKLGWREIFPLLSVCGFACAIWWFMVFRDEPAEHPQVTEEELSWIRPLTNRSRMPLQVEAHSSAVGMRETLLRWPVFFLCVMYFTQTYGFNLYVTWLPSYLHNEKHFQGVVLWFFTGLPLLLSVIADIAGGMFTNNISDKMGLSRGRKTVGILALSVAAVLLALGTAMHGMASAVMIALAAASSNFLLGAAWSACADIGGNYAGTVGAAMNTSGQIGGVLSPLVFAAITRNDSRWSFPLFLTAGLYFVGALCWYFIDTPLFREELQPCHS